MMNDLQMVKVFAPATSANMAVGFDILGFAVAGLGDVVTLEKSHDQSMKLVSISGMDSIPYDVQKNTATVAMQSMLDYLNLKQGFNLSIKKNIPLSSGLGGSAASSAAALVALNRFLNNPLPLEQLAEFALNGEEAACGAKHGDNVLPCLFGGITLIQSLLPVQVIQLPIIPLHVVLFHPHLLLDTRQSRAVLPQKISLSSYIKQSGQLAALISALYEKNYTRLESACVDTLVEPVRAHLIPDFYDLQEAAYQSGALACSISGSGPTLFALAKTKKRAQLIAKNMSLAFKQNSLKSDVVITTISSQGARVIDEA